MVRIKSQTGDYINKFQVVKRKCFSEQITSNKTTPFPKSLIEQAKTDEFVWRPIPELETEAVE